MEENEKFENEKLENEKFESSKIDIAKNLIKIKNKIQQTCANCGRTQNEVKLVAVSKFHPVEEIYKAIENGQFLFGENRVQEAKEKFTKIFNDESLKEKLNSSEKIQLHIIGSLQRNKVKDAVKIASCIESVDRIELLEEIEKQCAKIEKNIDVLLEVHTGEDSKSGFLTFEELQNVLSLFEKNQFPHICVKGFMTMAPFTEDVELIKKSFVTLRTYKEDLQKQFPSLELKELSMGMSNDFELAIKEGATSVRIGTSIFGPRVY